MEQQKLVLDGKSLKIKDLNWFTQNPEAKVEIGDAAKEVVLKCHAFLNSELETNNKIVYGINTGFGPMASHIISKNDLIELQENLVRSHACGIGSPIPEKYVLSSMVVRLNTLVKGYSGVSWDLVELFKNIINHRILPIVPEHGAVGTSGDLTQLAHIALVLIGEGKVSYQGKTRPTPEVFKEVGLTPIKLKPKEGLALINGTSVMSGITALICAETDQLLSTSIRTGALALELVHGFLDSISEKLHELRPHEGQVFVAGKMREILASSKLMRDRKILREMIKEENDVYKIPSDVQEVYSLRCLPQILGPIWEALKQTESTVEIEINSVTDNPLVDWENSKFIHGGNFHGDYVASAVDGLKASLVKLTILLERQINFFLNDKVNRSFPPFLNLKKPGLTLGLQGLQFVATSTTAQSQSLAFPHSIHSISTNSDNQDVVSMGTDAALFAAKVLENAYVVLTIELVTLAQAVDCHEEKEKLSNESSKLYDLVRSVSGAVNDDRPLTEELKELETVIQKSSLV
ncbi:MAG: histidine ammonia-lyase [Parcubacteria group bacterium Gr01-1014_20]|nr:MAG: histidine ammonia-lyase [Parcubacteria group bacterium Gr01-1014_20]